MSVIVEKLLRHERAATATALAMLTALAWFYIWQGAGMGMTAPAMTRLALFPHLIAEPMPGMTMPPITWLTVVFMWWIMMIAMMTPSAAPLVLLYGRVMRHAGRPQRTAPYVHTAILMTGYLVAWLAFSIAATLLQYSLQYAGLISRMMLWSQSATLSAVVLAAAGLYQLSPLKHACLKHCRGPVAFLTEHMRQGRLGALRMGLEHGIWCIGCCWILMALLFVGGIMNLVWIALISLLVSLEKIAPHGAMTGRIAGIVFIVWSLATLAMAG